MAESNNTPALQLLHAPQVKNSSFPALPCDARDAAARGFDVGGASFEFEDNFTGGSTMLRRGTLQVCNNRGEHIEIPFTAKFKFGKPYSEIADLEDLYERSVDPGEPPVLGRNGE